MAFNLGDIFVTFKAKTDDLRSGVAEVKTLTASTEKAVNGTSFKQFSSNASTAFGNVANSIQNVATKFAIVAAASSYGGSKFVTLASDLQTAQQRMAALSGSTEDAQKIMGQLYNYVLGKPIAFPEAAKAAQTLMGYGVQANNVVASMKTLSAFSIVNGADMSQLALAYGQVNAKGKLMGQEIIQLTNNFVPVSQVIAKHFNVSLQEAQSLMEGGQISAADFNAAMAEFIPQSAIDAQANTFKNRMISLQGSIRSFGLALLGVHVDEKLGLVVEQGGLFDRLSSWLPKIAKSLTELKPKIAGAFTWLVDHGDWIKAFLIGLAAAFVAAKLAAIGFAIAAAANPVTIIATAIVILIGLLVALQEKFNWVGQAMAFLQPIFTALGNIFTSMFLPSLQALWNSLSTQLFPALMQIWDAVMRLWNALNPGLMTAIQIIASIIGALWVAQIWLLINVFNIVVNVMGFAASMIANLIGWIANLVGWFGNLIGAGINAVSSIIGWFGRLPGNIGNIVNSIVGWFQGLPGRLVGALSGVAGALTAPFSNAFNSIKSLWNNTVGKIHFEVPSWVPGIGGKGWSFPQFAKGVENFAGGWAVVGERGPELAYLPQGTSVFSNDKSQAMMGRSVSVYGDINIDSPGDADYFLARIDRNTQLENMGVSPA